jgi:hypothetical protein
MYTLIKSDIGNIKALIIGFEQMTNIINAIDDDVLRNHIKHKYKYKINQYNSHIDIHYNNFDMIYIKDICKMNIERNRFDAKHSTYAIKYLARSHIRKICGKYYI